MSQLSTNSHPSSSSSKLHLKHKEYLDYPYHCIIFMDYKITRKEKNCPIQGTDECDKKYYISFFLEHETLESLPCHIFKQWCCWWWRLLCGWWWLEVSLAMVVGSGEDEQLVGEKWETGGWLVLLLWENRGQTVCVDVYVVFAAV